MPALSKRFAGRLVGAALAVALSLTATACGGSDEDKIVIGTKYDQPGLAIMTPDGLTGFDIEVATYVAQELGYAPEDIEWKEAPSPQRETMIQNGQVDYIVGTYSITDDRKQRVDFAGPYLITGQSLLVRADDTTITGPASLQDNRRLCSVTGSTPAQRIQDEYPGVQLQQYDTYSACVEALRNNAVDAVTTDEVILAGYVTQNPDALKVVGQPFSEEHYGIGLKKGDTDLQTRINDAIVKMQDEGAWQQAFADNLGPAGIATPTPPAIDQN